MEGPGTMFYEKTGNLLFRGLFKSGNFYNGTLFDDDGSKLKDVVPNLKETVVPTLNETRKATVTGESATKQGKLQ